MKKVLLLASMLVWAGVGQAVSLPEYHADMLKSYGMEELLKLDRVKENLPQIKIAVLERGFAEAEEPGNLPEGCTIVNQYDEEMVTKYDLNPGYEAPPVNEAHGRRVAQLVWALTGMSYEVSPQIYLLNANGLTNFRRAVRYAILEKVDIIVYAQNWEYGGNYDGKGFVNATVNEALEAGITWINAAGNYGGQVYNDKIQVNPEGNLVFSKVKHSGNKDKLFFTIQSDEKDARVVCVWNDFSDDRDAQSGKDLDLFIYEWDGSALGEKVGESAYAQVAIEPEKDEELSKRQASQLAREEVSLNGLRKNKQYAIMIKDRSGNFVSSKDRVRVIVQANSGVLTFDDHTVGGEIMIPADNPGVIAVGDLSESSSVGPTTDHRRKPEVILPPWMAEGQTNVYSDIPYAVFSDDTVVAGTSADAAIFAGMVAVLKANKPNISRVELLQFAGRKQAQWRSKRVEVVEPEPEYTVSESTPSGEVVEKEVVVVEREVVTVYSNPFFVGVGVGVGAVFVGPVLPPPPPVVIVPPPVVIPIIPPHHPGPPPPPFAGFHRPGPGRPGMGPVPPRGPAPHVEPPRGGGMQPRPAPGGGKPNVGPAPGRGPNNPGPRPPAVGRNPGEKGMQNGGKREMDPTPIRGGIGNRENDRNANIRRPSQEQGSGQRVIRTEGPTNRRGQGNPGGVSGTRPAPVGGKPAVERPSSGRGANTPSAPNSSAVGRNPGERGMQSGDKREMDPRPSRTGNGSRMNDRNANIRRPSQESGRTSVTRPSVGESQQRRAVSAPASGNSNNRREVTGYNASSSRAQVQAPSYQRRSTGADVNRSTAQRQSTPVYQGRPTSPQQRSTGYQNRSAVQNRSVVQPSSPTVRPSSPAVRQSSPAPQRSVTQSRPSVQQNRSYSPSRGGQRGGGGGGDRRRGR